MSVIIIPKNKPLIQFPDKKSATDYLKATGKNLDQYDIMYLYPEMSRRNFPPSFKTAHRKASRAYYQRNKERINAEKRAKYKQQGGKQ